MTPTKWVIGLSDHIHSTCSGRDDTYKLVLNKEIATKLLSTVSDKRKGSDVEELWKMYNIYVSCLLVGYFVFVVNIGSTGKIEPSFNVACHYVKQTRIETFKLVQWRWFKDATTKCCMQRNSCIVTTFEIVAYNVEEETDPTSAKLHATMSPCSQMNCFQFVTYCMKCYTVWLCNI